MTRQKQIRLGIILAAVVLLVAALIIGAVCLVNYHKTYISIGGVDYCRDAQSLDLSGQNIDGVEKLVQLPDLRELDLRDTGLTAEQYLNLCDLLPDCEILWSVPFQDGFYSSDSTKLTVTQLRQSDFEAFAYLPQLQEIDALACTDYEVLMVLAEQYPQYQLTYAVAFSGEPVDNHTSQAHISDVNLEEAMVGLQYLPALTQVTLEGTLPEVEELIALQQAYPQIQFVWEFELFGVTVDPTLEFVDLSGADVTDVTELERYLPCFYHLEQIDMVDCGVSNEDMAALRDRHPEVKIVWSVKVWSASVRTDATYFMPAKTHVARTGTLDNLKYCTDMVVLDFGHYHLTNVSFIESMPKLQYLLLCECSFTDLSVIGNCTELVTLELFKSRVTDFWPLTNLTKLRNLNLCKTPALEDERVGAFGDYTPLLQMTWLDRLWLTFVNLNAKSRNTLNETLSHTEIVYFHKNSSIANGWRHSYDYYYHRDVMDIYYMT